MTCINFPAADHGIQRHSFWTPLLCWLAPINTKQYQKQIVQRGDLSEKNGTLIIALLFFQKISSVRLYSQNELHMAIPIAIMCNSVVTTKPFMMLQTKHELTGDESVGQSVFLLLAKH